MADAERADGREADGAERRRGGGSWWWWVTCLPLLYVLSIGPAARLPQEMGLGKWLGIVYWPLGWFIEHSAWLQDVFYAYFVLCGVQME